jgi:serralysin
VAHFEATGKRNLLDVVTEGSNEGTDVVHARVNFTLGANVENIILDGIHDINATGNALANTMTGNEGNNVLNGGAGADAMTGGDGSDTYVVDNASDTTTELADQGYDEVQSSVTWTLGSNIEKLTLTGSTAINATGNTLNNVIVGNDMANTLTGGAGDDEISGGGGVDSIYGGQGSDSLKGDAGNDVFYFTATSDSNQTYGVDQIVDFASGDKINVSGVDANSITAGDQAFVLDTDGSFVAGEYQITNPYTGIYVVNFYTDNDNVADMTITVLASALVNADFTL